MGYRMRFISTDQRGVTTADLQNALVAADPGYVVDIDASVATIHHAGATIAHVEINVPGDGIFDAERDELVEFAADATGNRAAKRRVLDALGSARAIVAAQVLFGTGDTESTLNRLDPLWAWLFSHREGLLQADSEGYYDARALLLRV